VGVDPSAVARRRRAHPGSLREALAAGWILKDATPLNVLFVGTRPVFVDILSFERRDPRSSIWLAYGQYVRTFLLPLLMNRMLAWPLSLSLFKRDGYEPADCYAALGWGDRLSRAALWPITLPAVLDRRREKRQGKNADKRKDRRVKKIATRPSAHPKSATIRRSPPPSSSAPSTISAGAPAAPCPRAPPPAGANITTP
jgi:hypothetical protein